MPPTVCTDGIADAMRAEDGEIAAYGSDAAKARAGIDRDIAGEAGCAMAGVAHHQRSHVDGGQARIAVLSVERQLARAGLGQGAVSGNGAADDVVMAERAERKLWRQL
nr:hypothetical protein [Mesorhizobium sp. M7A.F.Ca.MR.362.00.0.0]